MGLVIEKELRWIGPQLDCSGYSAAGRGYVRSCEYGGVKVQVSDRSRALNLKNKGIDDNLLSIYKRLESNRVAQDATCVQHQVADCFYENKKTKLSIGFTIFEMNTVPLRWVPYCNMMDVIWTGSQFSKAAFMSTGVKTKIEVIPHALDLEKYNNKATPWEIKNKKGFCFLSIFDFTERKNWKTLLKAYWSAFSKQDDVCLILKVFFGGFSDEFINNIYEKIYNFRKECHAENGGSVLIYGHDVLDKDMPGLYTACDCYVGVSREGFGLPYAEAMACGLPCIGPEVGGTREFMDEQNSFLVKYTGDEEVGSETSRMYNDFAGIKWPTHSMDHLANLMKLAYENKEARQEKAKNGMEHIRQVLSFKAVGDKINKLIP